MRSATAPSETLLLIGSRSCLGRHVQRHLSLTTRHPFTFVNTLDFVQDEEEESIDVSYAMPGEHMVLTAGNLESLEEVMAMEVADVSTVIYCAAHMDVTIGNEEEKELMQIQNGHVVCALLGALAKSTVDRALFVSSMWLHAQWAEYGVNLTENCRVPPPENTLLPAFSRSLLDAERAFLDTCKANNIVATIVRPGELYGEWDTTSCIARLCRLGADRRMPIIGDRGGIVTLTYAGNVAQQMCEILLNVAADKIDGQVFFVNDNTPLQGPYQLLDKLALPGKEGDDGVHINFYLFYVLYSIFALVVLLAGKLGIVAERWTNYPTTGYVRAMLHDWNFVDDEKRRLLDIVPQWGYDTSIENCRQHYVEIGKGIDDTQRKM